MQWTACFHVGPLIKATLLNLCSKLMKLILTNLPLSKHNEVLGPCKCPLVCPMPPNFIEKKWHHAFPRSIFVWIVHEPHQNGKNNYIIQTTVAVMACRKNYRERSQKQMCSRNFQNFRLPFSLGPFLMHLYLPFPLSTVSGSVAWCSFVGQVRVSCFGKDLFQQFALNCAWNISLHLSYDFWQRSIWFRPFVTSCCG